MMLQRFESFEPRKIKERESAAKELREKEEKELEELAKKMGVMRKQLKGGVSIYLKYKAGRIFLDELKHVTTDESFPGYVMFMNEDGDFVGGYEPKHNTFSITTGLLNKINLKYPDSSLMIKNILERLFNLKNVHIKPVI